MKRNKIVFFVFSLQAGGIETYLLRFLKQYRNIITPSVIVKNGEKGDLYDEFLKTGATIILMKTGYFNMRAWIRLFLYLKREKFDAVCDMGANFAGIPLTIARSAGVKKRIAFYRQSSHLFKTSKFNLIYANFVNWLVYKNATAILANSQHAFDFYFGRKIDNRFKVIKNGVDKTLFDLNESKAELRNYFGLPDDKIIIGHTGRFTPAKNHSTILEVARRLCTDRKDVIFVLAGNDTHHLPEQEGIIHLGYCSEIPKLLKTFDIFYFPSVTEGQPNALIEAMISGLPFIASNIEPIKESVPAKHHSQLISATDVESSVEMIQNMLNAKDRTQYSCRDWAINEYDAERNFNLFFKELV